MANFFSLLGPSGCGKTTPATASKSFRSTSLFHEAATLA
jgi:ABC-type nitrate/sulfonate/bicarbonate transport system ATPase subunit